VQIGNYLAIIIMRTWVGGLLFGPLSLYTGV